MDSFDVTFQPTDPLNPGFGYFLSITRNGHNVWRGNKHPVTGDDLTPAACLEVAGMYVLEPPSAHGHNFLPTRIHTDERNKIVAYDEGCHCGAKRRKEAWSPEPLVIGRQALLEHGRDDYHYDMGRGNV